MNYFNFYLLRVHFKNGLLSWKVRWTFTSTLLPLRSPVYELLFSEFQTGPSPRQIVYLEI